MNLEKKIELAIWLCKYNPNIAITGSMMLYLRWIQKKDHTLENFYLGREPQDLDFIVNVDDDFDYDSILTPPFIKDEERVESEITGYPILKRFYYEDVKVEFIEAPHYRYTEEYIPYKFDNLRFSTCSFLRDFYANSIGKSNIRLALVTDLYAAKLQYIKNDDNADYIEKSKQDVNKLDMIMKERYLDEYFVIINSYLKNDWCHDKRVNDYGRDVAENLIEKYIVTDSTKTEWLNYMKAIDHNYLSYFSEWYRREKDRYYSSMWYTYEVEKYIEDLIYEFKIPFKIT